MWCTRSIADINMDTLGIEPRAFRMRSGCDTTTPCAQGDHARVIHISEEYELDIIVA